MNETEPKIYHSEEKKEIPIPKIPFEKFYEKFDFINEVKESQEWEEIYSNYYSFDSFEEEIYLHETTEDMETYDIDQQRDEIIKCANSFSYFCTKYAKIAHPTLGIIRLIPYKYQKRVIECYNEHRFNILSKFRQGGLTTISVAWGLWRCLFKTGQRIMVVSKTDREAIAAGEVAKTIMEYLPSWLQPETDKCNEHEKQFKTTGSVLWFYTVEAARGKSITILIIDEAAFISDMGKHWKALYPVISTGGSCEVVSTVNGMGNWYEEMYHGAEAGKNKFNIIELDFWEHPLYNNPEWIEEQRSALGEKGFAQEIERSFLQSGDTWINPVVLSSLAEETRNNMPARMALEKWQNKSLKRKYEWDEGALWVWKEPLEDREYIIGADCAEGVGEEGDNSSFQVIDQGSLEQVAEFYSNTVPPHIFAQILNHMGYYYNGGLIVVENANQGVAVIKTLQHDLAYEHLYFEQNKQESGGIKTSKVKRPLFLQALQERLLNGTLKVNSPRLVTELQTFIFNPVTKRPEAQKRRHDDAIFALSLALYVRDSMFRDMPPGAEMPDEMMQVFKSEIYEEIRNEIVNQDLEEFLEIENEEELSLLSEFEKMINVNQSVKRPHDKILKEFGW
ncbi:MAG: hypothetical protein DWQ19_12370 [Crenarchaeota archaeon]|nr:MAG: hypothetical protein DWQ19_12370 [Thermoproteota archaeon]